MSFTMKQRESFAQRCRAYAKAPNGMTLNGIPSIRQNALNRFRTALYERCSPASVMSEGMHVDLSMKAGNTWLVPVLAAARSFRERERSGVLPQADALFFSTRQNLSQVKPDWCRTLRYCSESGHACAQIKAPEKEKSAASVPDISRRDAFFKSSGDASKAHTGAEGQQ